MLRCAERVQGVAGQRSKHFPPNDARRGQQEADVRLSLTLTSAGLSAPDTAR
jgi:hypothetical protein